MGSRTGTEIVLSPAQRRVTKWDDDGNPIVVLQPVLTKQDIKSMYFIIAAQPYEFEDMRPDAIKYKGMTAVEILVRKQVETAIKTADVDAIERIMDRLIDKPISKSENMNFNASYEDALKNIAQKAGITIEATVVEDDVALVESIFK